MKTILLTGLLVGGLGCSLMAQDFDIGYYAQIPAAPAAYSAEGTVARMIDGLGFRYYWATEGLRDTDLAYRPVEGARSTRETLVHVYGLSLMIVHGVEATPNERAAVDDWTLAELREGTLAHVKQASMGLQAAGVPMAEREMVWGSDGERATLPFWNLINGPISDALYHTGQVVAFRRASGNPMPAGVNVLQGVRREH